jgi:hypothetical protein
LEYSDFLAKSCSARTLIIVAAGRDDSGLHDGFFSVEVSRGQNVSGAVIYSKPCYQTASSASRE